MSFRPALLCVPVLLLTACAQTISAGMPDDDGGQPPNGDGAMPPLGDGGIDPCAPGNLDLTGCACQTAGATRACYTGSPPTQNVGLCKDGSQSCVSQGEFFVWGPCAGEVKPAAEVCTDTGDHDCDGLVGCADPSCVGLPGCCAPGTKRPCYQGPPMTEGVGPCMAGFQTCDPNGAWTACSGEVLPAAEPGHCSDRTDNDCNGLPDCLDPGCAGDPICLPPACQAGTKRLCYDGPAGTQGIGPCRPGTQTCDALGQWEMTCVGQVVPGPEAGHCQDGLDNDCNGARDCMDAACAADPACQPRTCQPGATQVCYSGPAGSAGIGPCKTGTLMCTPQGQWSMTCAGEVTPTPEFGHCQDGVDNDCNGAADCQDVACALDPACAPRVCQPGATRPCYGGPPGSAGIGQCRQGTETCVQGQWSGNCVGEVRPGNEAGHCADGADNDCNGAADCRDLACVGDPACPVMVCQPGTTRACYDGPNGTAGIGPCKTGLQTCNQQGQWTATCVGEVVPAGEAGKCTDQVDNNCNGTIDCADNACQGDPACPVMVCQPNATRTCYSGPLGTAGVGQCRSGTQTCNAQGQWNAACNGEVTPGNEFGRCNDNIDNDCDGAKDCLDIACTLDVVCRPTFCMPGATQSCYSGPPGSEGWGVCRAGVKTCLPDGSAWGPCTGEVLPQPEWVDCTDGDDNDCDGYTDCDDPYCELDVACCTPTTFIDTTIWGTSANTLYILDSFDWSEISIGQYGVADSMTDIAMTPSGNLYTISHTALYSVNPASAQATWVMNLPGTHNNALTFLPDDTLLAADETGMLKVIDPVTRTVSNIGTFGSGLTSSGDIVAVADGYLFGVSATRVGGAGATGNNLLLVIDSFTGQASDVGPTGFGNVFALAYYGTGVVAATGSGQVIEIDVVTGQGTLLNTLGHPFYGLTTSPLVPLNGCP